MEEQSTRRNSKTLASETLLGWTQLSTLLLWTPWGDDDAELVVDAVVVWLLHRNPLISQACCCCWSLSLRYSTLNWSRYLISQFVQLLLLGSILYLNSLLSYPHERPTTGQILSVFILSLSKNFDGLVFKRFNSTLIPSLEHLRATRRHTGHRSMDDTCVFVGFGFQLDRDLI